jgi:hypothetical protein
MAKDDPDTAFAVYIGETYFCSYDTREEAEAALRRIGNLDPHGVAEIRAVPVWEEPSISVGGRDLADIVATVAEIEKLHPAKTGRVGGKERAKRKGEDGQVEWRAYAERLARRSPAHLSQSGRARWIKDHWQFEGRDCPARSTLMELLHDLGKAE